ncbi:hypothetical protein Trco_004586 [Trichoderma cornu-damae]|uniref:Uncharacterized protein n=1 Tax=Trichoderma cornu-damae TaxID=654480 RepID=A0A9P8TX92_9HYPO|nr:hypothetical protein Trco_004586 [Trichoderma cornu-damae]
MMITIALPASQVAIIVRLRSLTRPPSLLNRLNRARLLLRLLPLSLQRRLRQYLAPAESRAAHFGAAQDKLAARPAAVVLVRVLVLIPLLARDAIARRLAERPPAGLPVGGVDLALNLMAQIPKLPVVGPVDVPSCASVRSRSSIASPWLRFRPRVRVVPSCVVSVCASGSISVSSATANLCFFMAALMPGSSLSRISSLRLRSGWGSPLSGRTCMKVYLESSGDAAARRPAGALDLALDRCASRAAFNLCSFWHMVCTASTSVAVDPMTVTVLPARFVTWYSGSLNGNLRNGPLGTMTLMFSKGISRTLWISEKKSPTVLSASSSKGNLWPRCDTVMLTNSTASSWSVAASASASMSPAASAPVASSRFS